RARLGDRPVPEREVALRIVHAAVERLAAARLALDDLAAVLRAAHTGRLVLDVLAGRIAAARGELAEPSLLDDQVLPALRAGFLAQLSGLGSPDALLLGDDLPGRPALRVAGAGEEHAEPPAARNHGTSAVLARFLELVGRRLRLIELARVVALGVAA